MELKKIEDEAKNIAHKLVKLYAQMMDDAACDGPYEMWKDYPKAGEGYDEYFNFLVESGIIKSIEDRAVLMAWVEENFPGIVEYVQDNRFDALFIDEMEPNG